MSKVKITDRYRPDSEIPRWVWDEIKALEESHQRLDDALRLIRNKADPTTFGYRIAFNVLEKEKTL